MLPSDAHAPLPRPTLAALAVLLTVAWFGGGATVDVTATDEWLALLSLPVLALGLMAWLQAPPTAAVERAALAAAGLLALVPLLQWLLPLSGGAGRRAIIADLTQAGVSAGIGHASLTPQATEHAVWSLLPPLACFLGAALLGHRWRRRAVQLALALVLANLAFGFFQAGLPNGHALRLYTNNGTGFGGVLVNGNHQASALVTGMLLALGLAAEARRRNRDSERSSSPQTWAYLAAAVVCFLCIPLAGSTAGMLIGVLLLAIGIPATGLLGSLRRSRGANRIALGAVAVLGVLGIAIAAQWMDLAQTDPLRHAAARETWALGQQYLPLGSGVGSFVQTFEQAAGPLFLRGEYVNHAHNEYAQWWLEGGLLALLAALAAFAVLGWIGARLLRDRHQRPLGVACWLGLGALLLHSVIDFPLRTLSLMTLAGLLAGLALAEARRERESRSPLHPDAALQQA